MGALHRGHAKRNGGVARRIWQSLEGIDIAHTRAGQTLPCQLDAELRDRSDPNPMSDKTDSRRLLWSHRKVAGREVELLKKDLTSAVQIISPGFRRFCRRTVDRVFS